MRIIENPKGKEFRSIIVRPAILELNFWSPKAEELLMFTWAHESEGGTFTHQIGGPALGVFGMEPATHEDIWDNYIKYHYGLSKAIGFRDVTRLVRSTTYATQMCRVHYLRVKETLPDTTPEAMGAYWGKHYQTQSDPKKINDAIDDYKKYVKDEETK